MIRIALAAFIGMTAQAFAAETYIIDKSNTEIRFSWSKFGVSRSTANFKEYSGQLNYDAAAPEKSTLNVKIDPASIKTQESDFDKELTGDKWFNAAKFPGITFKSKKLERTGDKTGKLIGDLTMKGITKPVTLDVKLNFAGKHPVSKKPTLGVIARTTVQRSDFDLGAYAPLVSDDVLIEIKTELNKK